jgi:hypothetical protein
LYDGAAGGAQLITGFDNPVLKSGSVQGWVHADPGTPSTTTAKIQAITNDGHRCVGAVGATIAFQDYVSTYSAQGQVELYLYPTNGRAVSSLTATKLHYSAKVIIPDLATLGVPTIQATFSGVSAAVQYLHYPPDASNPDYPGVFTTHSLDVDGQWHDYTLDIVPNAPRIVLDGGGDGGFDETIVDAGGTLEFSSGNVSFLFLQFATQDNANHQIGANPNPDLYHSSVAGGVVFDGGYTVNVQVLFDDVWVEGPNAHYVRN